MLEIYCISMTEFSFCLLDDEFWDLNVFLHENDNFGVDWVGLSVSPPTPYSFSLANNVFYGKTFVIRGLLGLI